MNDIIKIDEQKLIKQISITTVVAQVVITFLVASVAIVTAFKKDD